MSDSALYGIDDEIVGQYESMGFPRDKTIQVLRRMGIKSFKGVGIKVNWKTKSWKNYYENVNKSS